MDKVEAAGQGTDTQTGLASVQGQHEFCLSSLTQSGNKSHPVGGSLTSQSDEVG